MSSLPQIELWALKAALEGKHDRWRSLPITLSQTVRQLCSALERSGNSIEAINTVQRTIALLMPDVLIDLARTDVDTPPEIMPKADAPDRGDEDMPDLPKSCRLTPAEERQAESVGHFEREYVAWAAAVANQTPVAISVPLLSS